jgi:flagellar protein FlaF
MYSNAMSNYESVDNLTMPGRGIEAAVLTKAARKLRDCRDNWKIDDNDRKLEEALKYNQRIWSVFQVELARDDHPLPKQLRSDILKLSAFIDRRIFETLASPSPDKLNIVIRINENLAAGLRGSAADSE